MTAESTLAGSNTERVGRWWDADKGNAHLKCNQFVSLLGAKQTAHRLLDKNHLRIYGNFDPMGTGITAATALERLRGEDGRMRYQLCTAIVDSAVPLITSNKPLPYYLTEGASFTEQKKARKLTKAIQGQFWDLGVYEMAPKLAREGMVLGTAALFGYVDPDTGKPALERCLPGEILVDLSEGIAGDVRSVYRIRAISRDKLKATYTKKAKELDYSSTPTITDWKDFFLTADGTADLVIVIEAWHLRSGKDAKDGRHIICTNNATLFDEAWNEDEFPFVFLRWKDRLLGFWGLGLVEETKAAQLRINRLINHTERQQNIAAKVWVYVEEGSKVSPQQIIAADKVPVQVLKYAGQAPVIYQHQSVDPGLMQQIYAIRDEAMGQVGLTQTSMQGEKQAGITSGTALETMEDISSRRHMENIRQYERFFIEVARLIERLNDKASELAKADGKVYTVKAIENRGRQEFRREVAWKDLKLKSSAKPRVFPISALPSTPTGKLQYVQNWLQAGFISPMWAMKLFDFPDTDEAMSLELADLELVLQHMEALIEDEEDVDPDSPRPDPTPTPMQDLELAVDLSRKFYVKVQGQGADPQSLSRVQKYYDQAKSLLEQAQAETAKKQAAMNQSAQAATMGPTAMVAPPMQGQQPPQMAPAGPPMPGALAA